MAEPTQRQLSGEPPMNNSTKRYGIMFFPTWEMQSTTLTSSRLITTTTSFALWPKQATARLHSIGYGKYWGGMLEEGATSMWEAYDPRWYKEDFHASSSPTIAQDILRKSCSRVVGWPDDGLGGGSSWNRADRSRIRSLSIFVPISSISLGPKGRSQHFMAVCQVDARKGLNGADHCSFEIFLSGKSLRGTDSYLFHRTRRSW